jgi:hypothetical protein
LEKGADALGAFFLLGCCMNESTVKLEARATWTHDLSQSERRFLVAIQELRFGRFESLRIHCGQLALEPWPRTVRYVKLGSEGAVSRREFNDEFEFEGPVIALLEYVRAVDQGELLRLEVRHSRPFLMEIDYQPKTNSVGWAARI